MSKNPKVTVLMSVYNGEKYLRKAIDSILNQTFKDFEFIIINDASTDSTRDIILSYDDTRIRLINNEANIGLTKSLNKGLGLANGEYIARQDADDFSAPQRLEKQIEFLNAHRDYAVVGSFVKIMDKDSRVVQDLERPTEDEQIREYLAVDNCIPHGSAMIRKEGLLDMGLYDESIERSQDYELWLRLSDKYKLANIPEYLYMWREHEERIGAKCRDEQSRFVAIAKKKAQERRIVNILKDIKNKRINLEKATSLVINVIVGKYMASESKALKPALLFIKSCTFNRIGPSKSYRTLARIRFSKRINKTLRDFQMGNISLDNAKIILNEILSGVK